MTAVTAYFLFRVIGSKHHKQHLKAKLHIALTSQTALSPNVALARIGAEGGNMNCAKWGTASDTASAILVALLVAAAGIEKTILA